MNESVHVFGRSSGLVGVLSRSEANTRNTAVLLLNAGLMSRIGPFRLYVRIARALARLGYDVLRFDLSGIGESLLHAELGSHSDHHISDVQDAIDFLHDKFGYEEFILAGICMGADVAFKVTSRDERVAGAYFVDVYAYPTLGFYIRRIGLRLRAPFTRRAWLKRINRLLKNVDFEREVVPDPKSVDYYYTRPPKENVMDDMRKMIDRNVQLCFVFTSSEGSYRYEGQFRDAFGDLATRDQVDVQWMRGATHIFHFSDTQRLLIDSVTGWISSRFPPKQHLQTATTRVQVE